METIILISGKKQIPCSNLVYFARQDQQAVRTHVPSHLVARPSIELTLDEICYVRLKRGRVPVLVAAQPDGSVWLGGAYLDTIAQELRLIPRPLPHEMEAKSKEWLKAVGDRWQIPHNGAISRES